MGSTANKFVSLSLTLALFLYLGYLVLLMHQVAQGPPEAVILEQELKEASRVLRQQQWEDERAREQVILQHRLARQFGTLQVKATTRHAIIEQWRARTLANLTIKW
jgi:hypothetical protein